MMYFIERVNTWKATNQKVAELSNYVKQCEGTLIYDRYSLDALVEDIRHKVDELNEAYPKTKKLVVVTGVDYVSCHPAQRNSDSDAVFTFNIHCVRRRYKRVRIPTEEEMEKNIRAAEYLNSFGTSEPTANPQRTYNDDVNMKGGAQ